MPNLELSYHRLLFWFRDCCEHFDAFFLVTVLVDVMVKIPDLRGNILTWSNVQQIHTLSSPSIKTLLGGLVDHLPVPGVSPLLLATLPVTHGHLHLLQPLGEGSRHRGTVVLPP